MIAHFYDQQDGGFFDMPNDAATSAIGALTARRKPFQDSPTPAGDSAAALALLRLYSLTNEKIAYRELATKTLEIFAGVAEQFGIYAGTYGLAAIWLARPYTQVVLVGSRSGWPTRCTPPPSNLLRSTRLYSCHRRGGRRRLSPAGAHRLRAAPARHCRGTAAGDRVQQFHLSASGQRSRGADEIDL